MYHSDFGLFIGFRAHTAAAALEKGVRGREESPTGALGIS